MSADPNDDWNWAYELTREPVWREQLIGELDGAPIGMVQIIDPELEETHYWGDIGPNKRAIDIWIGLASNLGKGYGTRMMILAIQRCFAAPEVEVVLIDPLESNTDAHRFYERLGFVFVEAKRFGEDDTFVYKIDRENFLEKYGL
jgi:aminoglycoside 6'-N-acetyltransferase